MNRSIVYLAYLFSAAVLLGCFFAGPAPAEDSAINPKYSAWAKFKPGSSSTVEADVEAQGSKVHVTLTKTLVSVDGDKVVVQTRSTASIKGQAHDAPAHEETILARKDPESFKPIGEKDVEAMGKTLHCHVYESKARPDAKPGKTSPAGEMDNMTATICISDEVPGGLVRLDGVGQNGKNLTFILTGMDVK